MNHDQRNDHSEIGIGALKIILLLFMAPTAEEQRQADHAVEDYHDHGEQGVAGQGGVVFAMQHDGGDARNLDEGDRQGQQQRPVRLAKACGQMFRVTDN
jgi:hypothetical protein